MITKISEDDKKEMTIFREETEKLFNKHNFAAAYVTVILKPKNPDWQLQADRKWLIDDVLYMSKDFQELIQSFQDKERLSTENRIMLMDLYHNIIIVLNKMAHYHVESYEQVKGWIFELTESLGLDKSRIIPLEPDTEYHIFTEANNVYQLKYDKKYRFFIKHLEGDKETNVIPKEALSLIGCLQDDGALFGIQYAPAISTGDKIMFQYYPFDPDKGITTDTFLTDTVLDVVKSANVN